MKFVVFNADDFGFGEGINRAIVDCHQHGVVTSTSLMVTGRYAKEAVALSKDCPDLAVGLHWDVWGEDEREFDLNDLTLVRDEFNRQLDTFERMMGRLPTHIDSHRHAHRRGPMELFRELVAPLDVPLRDDGRVRYIGHFYAQWDWGGPSNLEYISVRGLQRWLETEVSDGWNELSCHPGYRSPDWSGVYEDERELEAQTLMDPAIRSTIDRLGIGLVSFAEFPKGNRK